MASRKILPIGAAAGLLYYYDQNVNPIISSNFQQLKKETPPPETIGKKVSAKSEELKKSFNDNKKDLENKVQAESKGISNSIEKQYNKLESKTSELYNKLSFNDVSKEAENLKKDVKNEYYEKTGQNKSLVRSTVAGYIDYINEFGDYLLGRSPTPVLTNKQKQQSWFAWGASVTDDAIENFDFDRAKSVNDYKESNQRLTQLTREFQNKHLTREQQKLLDDAQKDVNNSLDQLSKYGREFVDNTTKAIEDSKKSWFNWGSAKRDELSDQYNKQKDLAIKKYEESKKKMDELAAKTFKTDDEKKEYLKQAENDLNNAMTQLSKFGSNLSAEINERLQKSKKSWWNWSSKKSDELSQSWEQGKDSANEQYEIAKKKYDDLVYQIKQGLVPEKEKEEHLKKAQSDLNSAWNNLKKIVG
ncbi:hypothetical protein CLIB1444_02S08218 [[Candida] jaroonii]|uniref:Uncharacterized protein n=1 Tax=[Candida] jaroonii TaxID=467808 RepID=A0ACA9Y3C1_9ASCO|nr:hypothetical protein CLIB1444_02S08218 [[Candida] jaroonii]